MFGNKYLLILLLVCISLYIVLADDTGSKAAGGGSNPEIIHKNTINIYGNKSSFATRGFLRAQNTNIATTMLLEVPSARVNSINVIFWSFVGI
ncbi:hypothetical protein TSAR_007186 [Trichomalopsis sarcophagae]|uniref:Uncharacterized protein n=1 Tax=Trichomalopsis sarcophagae TaxID=543379 RepID=A0A232FIK2_9HYME|nr:hypothetical protein TSAR_007186 [Trichomalopsis sarcophagae]